MRSMVEREVRAVAEDGAEPGDPPRLPLRPVSAGPPLPPGEESHGAENFPAKFENSLKFGEKISLARRG